jgi:hypothetical protein
MNHCDMIGKLDEQPALVRRGGLLGYQRPTVLHIFECEKSSESYAQFRMIATVMKFPNGWIWVLHSSAAVPRKYHRARAGRNEKI